MKKFFRKLDGEVCAMVAVFSCLAFVLCGGIFTLIQKENDPKRLTALREYWHRYYTEASNTVVEVVYTDGRVEQFKGYSSFSAEKDGVFGSCYNYYSIESELPGVEDIEVASKLVRTIRVIKPTIKEKKENHVNPE